MKRFNCFITLLTSDRADQIIYNLLQENIGVKPIGGVLCMEEEDTIGACLACELSFHHKHEWVKNDITSVRNELVKLVKLTNDLNIKAFSIIVSSVGASVGWHGSNVKREEISEKPVGSPYRDKGKPK